MAVDQKVKEALSITTTDEQVDFLLKYYPDLKSHKKNIKHLIGLLQTHQAHKIPNRNNRPGPNTYWSGRSFREEYSDRLKKLESFRENTRLWETTPAFIRESRAARSENHFDDIVSKSVDKMLRVIDAAITVHKKYMPSPGMGRKRGRKKELGFSFLLMIIKDLWIEKLGHKKFFYDTGNWHEGLANDFVDDFILAEYRGKKTSDIKGLREAIRIYKDVRRVRKKGQRKISKVNPPLKR